MEKVFENGGAVLNADAAQTANKLEFLYDVKLAVSVEFGSTSITIGDLLGLKSGSIIELDNRNGEPVAVKLNGRLVARGEVVVINDNYGIRLTEIIDPGHK